MPRMAIAAASGVGRPIASVRLRLPSINACASDEFRSDLSSDRATWPTSGDSTAIASSNNRSAFNRRLRDVRGRPAARAVMRNALSSEHGDMTMDLAIAPSASIPSSPRSIPTCIDASVPTPSATSRSAARPIASQSSERSAASSHLVRIARRSGVLLCVMISGPQAALSSSRCAT